MAARDEAAFEAFVSVRSADLLRTAVLLTHDRGHAEDLLRAARVKAYRRWPRIAADDPYPHVRRVVVNEATSWWRLRATQDNAAIPPRDQPVADATEMVAEHERLLHALGSLPVRMRTVLVLRYPRT